MAAYRCGVVFRLAAAAVAGLCLAQTQSSATPNEDVDLALVIATDVSYSVDENEARFQRQGAVAAFRNPEVVKAIQSGTRGRIAVAYIDFATIGTNKVIAGWHVVHDKASAGAFADILEAAPRTLGVNTSISSGIEMAVNLLQTSGYTAGKRMIDVSGDGPNNEGHLVDRVRDEVVAKGIVINGLPIMLKEPQPGSIDIKDLDIYYEDCVIGGPGAFVVPMREREKFKDAIRTKMVLDIAQHDGAPRVIPAAARAPRISCTIGEQMWQNRWGRGLDGR